MIEFRNVSKYRLEHGIRRFILKDASFVIPDRTSVAMFSFTPGDNIQILRMISGIMPLDQGKVLTDSKISWPLGEMIGMSNTLSGRQNIRFVCSINGLGGGRSKKVVEMIAEFTGLGKHIDDPMGTYRFEMKSRLSFALSIALQFDYFLVARQIAVGSGEFRRKSRDAFFNAARRSAVVLATSNMKLARMLCSSALVVKNGEAVYYDNLEEGITAVRENFQSLPEEGGMKRSRGKKASRAARRSADGKVKKKSRKSVEENPAPADEG